MRARVSKALGEEYVNVSQAPRFKLALEHFLPHLLRVNMAWVVMLARQGVIPREDALAIVDTTLELRARGAEALPFDPAREEIFMHVEAYVGERVGHDVSGHIGMGRTRPEPITRMVVREHLVDTLAALADLRAALIATAARHVDTVMPGYTHLQHAQPTTLAHYLMAVQDVFGRDFRRLRAAYETVNRDTLGCGALSGTALPVDRAFLDEVLGFGGMVENTMDCVSATDYLTEPMAAVAVAHTTMSRLATDISIWVTSEFALAAIDDSHATVSSLMPQKKNPASVESVRARSALIAGNLMSVLGAAHGVPFQDMTDNYTDTGPLTWGTLDTASGAMRLLASIVGKLAIDADLALERVSRGFATTTALAETIAAHGGVSYRQAHTVVAKIVGELHASGRHAVDIDAAIVNRVAGETLGRPLGIEEAAVRTAVDPVAFVAAHNLPGGPAPDTVRAMIADREIGLSADRADIAALRDGIAAVDANLDRVIEELRG